MTKQVIARTNVLTGQQWFHPDYETLQPHVQYLVHLHEQAHLQLGTTDEIAAWKHSVPKYLERYSHDELQDAINQIQIWDKTHNAAWANIEPVTLSALIALATSAGSTGIGLWGQNKYKQAQKDLINNKETQNLNQQQDLTQAGYEQAIANAVSKEKLSATLTYIGGAISLVVVFILIYKNFKKS